MLLWETTSLDQREIWKLFGRAGHCVGLIVGRNTHLKRNGRGLSLRLMWFEGRRWTMYVLIFKLVENTLMALNEWLLVEMKRGLEMHQNVTDERY